MTQKTAFSVATLLTVFLVVVIVGVGIRVAQQATPAAATTAAASSPAAAEGGALASDIQPAQAQREADYQAALEQANQRLTEANRQLQESYRQQQALAEQLQRLSQPSPASQPVSSTEATSAQVAATEAGQPSQSLLPYDPRSGSTGERRDHKDDHHDESGEGDDD